MTRYEPFDVVAVPFPYTDRPVRQRRPALIVATGLGTPSNELVWVLIITSARNRSCAGDIKVTDQARSGLPAPSVVRTAKIATIEARSIQAVIGKLGRSDREGVIAELRKKLPSFEKVSEPGGTA